MEPKKYILLILLVFLSINLSIMILAELRYRKRMKEIKEARNKRNEHIYKETE